MNRLKDFFYYSRTERNGVITLISILLLLILLPYTYACFSTKPILDFSPWEADIKAFEEGMSQKALASSQFKKNAKDWNMNSVRGQKKVSAALKPQKFDPNTASSMDLEAMGLPVRTIKSILNYRAKGGQFRDKESLEKIYTLSEEHYQQLYPFIDLESRMDRFAQKESFEPQEAKPLAAAFDFDPNTATGENFEALGLASNTVRSILNYREKGGQFRKTEDFQKIYTLPDSVYQHLKAHIKIAPKPTYSTKKQYAPKAYRNIDINTASLEDFQQFRGIGPSYAKRILKMRESLGGFWNIKQVGELYKLPDSTFQVMLPHLECASVPLDKININTATIDELKAHPYLRWFHAKAIIRYRETEGLWKSVDLVQILTEFDDGKGTFQKIKPYLTID
jgi:DNA uptake protein ComE-like DNA-binding protein